MNCNSNTMPLIDNVDKQNCNTPCDIKDILVLCKEIIIPSGQEVLALEGENNASSRTFLLPKTSENGTDLTDKNITLVIEKADGSILPYFINETELLENYIKFIWNITSEVTNINGNLNIYIQITSKEEQPIFIWKSNVGIFKIGKSFKTIIPPINNKNNIRKES